MKKLALVAAVLASLLLVRCGTEEDKQVLPGIADAGTSNDSGEASADAGNEQDAGTSADPDGGGSSPDAGSNETDAGADGDAGSDPDAGDWDGSIGYDAGSGDYDAGAWDGSIGYDAGNGDFDAGAWDGSLDHDAGSGDYDAGASWDGGPAADAGSTFDPCTFNADCIASERCECDELTGCFCVLGTRGTGLSGVDPCIDGNDCETALCVEGNGGLYYCSGPCTTGADCGAQLPICANISFLGQICVRDPNAH